MCGIAGALTRGNARAWEPRIAAALEEMRHRGPDDRGVETVAGPDGGAVLGNVRLAVIDLSPRGHMPMLTEDGLVALTYNGEIFNFRELRSELVALGHRFRSDSDSEVILRGYVQWGDAVVPRLNGMFAIAIADRRAGAPRFVLARDHLGVKPCYWVRSGPDLVFASELKGLRAAGVLPRDVDWQAIADYFTYLFIPGPRTAYAGVQQIPPGHTLTWDGAGAPRVERYWDPLAADAGPRDAAEAEARTRALLEDSVVRQLVSDVPLGVFLSGGIDSTILTGLAARHTEGALRTFTVVFEGEGIRTVDDSEYARRVSAMYGTDHRELTVDVSRPEDIFEVGEVFDQPFGNPTFYLSYLISRATREHVTVALSGAGGDELFAGYPRYRALPYAGLLRLVPRAAEGALRGAAGLWRESDDGALPRRVKLFLRGAGLPLAEQYVRWTYYFSDEEKARLLRPFYADRRDLRPATRHVAALLERAGARRDLGTRAQYADLETFLPDNILEYTDRTSMATSLEVRVPFLDHRLVELSFGMPFDLKLRGATSKWILRRAFGDLIPRESLDAPKRGFCPPLAVWMRKHLDGYFDREMSPGEVARAGLFDPTEIARLREEHRRGVRDNSMELFGLIMFDRWWRRREGR